MPMDFLRRIEDAAFPLAVHEAADVRCVAVLVAANFIEASLPPVDEDSASLQQAVILRITPLGRAQLHRLRDKQDSTGT